MTTTMETTKSMNGCMLQLHSMMSQMAPQHTACYIWVPGDFSDELDKTQSVFPSISHSEMELEGEMVGKVIRVYWGKEKTWFTGVVASFDMETKSHTVSYSDGDDEDIDMLTLDSDRPAWEISPFSEPYFGF